MEGGKGWGKDTREKEWRSEMEKDSNRKRRMGKKRRGVEGGGKGEKERDRFKGKGERRRER